MGKITYDCLEDCEYILGTLSTQIITWPQDTPSIAVQLLSRVWPYGLQNARLLYFLLFSRVCSNSCPSSQWCHPTISSSVIPFSSCSQHFPASESFPMSWLFTSRGQSIGASASPSVLPMNIQGWFSLGLTDLISLQFTGVSRVFFSMTIWKHQFFSTQPSLWSKFHIYTWLLVKLQLCLYRPL